MLLRVSGAPRGDRDGSPDFFVSYTSSDQLWAEWISWVLEDAGFRVVVQAWDFGPGAHFVAEMHRAARHSSRTIAVVSRAYQASVFATEEWQAAWVADPSGRERRLLAFRVEDCAREGLLGQLVTVDLFGVDRDIARERLLAAVRGQRLKPAIEPLYPRGIGAGVAAPAGEPVFPSPHDSDWGNSAPLWQQPLPVIADSVTVVAALLVVVIAATGTGTSLVAWAVPLGMAALGLRSLAQRSWSGLVAGLLIANAVGATVTVWTEPAGYVGPKVVLTVLAGLAVATLGVAAMSPRSRSGRRLVMLGDLLAAASLPAYFVGILVQQTRGADGAAAALGLRIDAVAIFILAVFLAVFWGIFVALRLVAAPRPRPRLLAGLVALQQPVALVDGIAAISANHVLGLPAVLLVTVAVTPLIVAAVQQARANWGSTHADHSDASHHHGGSAG